MALGEQTKDLQSEMWIATQDLVRPEGHPFYQKLNEVLKKAGFDQFVERRCRRFYRDISAKRSSSS